MTELALSLVKMVDGVVDIGISAEVGDKVTSLWVFTCLGPVPMVSDDLFSKTEVSIGIADIGILWSEVWDEIILLKSSLLGGW